MEQRAGLDRMRRGQWPPQGLLPSSLFPHSRGLSPDRRSLPRQVLKLDSSAEGKSSASSNLSMNQVLILGIGLLSVAVICGEEGIRQREMNSCWRGRVWLHHPRKRERHDRRRKEEREGEWRPRGGE